MSNNEWDIMDDSLVNKWLMKLYGSLIMHDSLIMNDSLIIQTSLIIHDSLIMH